MALQHAALLDTVCLEVRGADAAAFLHAQLSRAVLDLDPADAPLAGWADPRGRVRALLRVCRLPALAARHAARRRRRALEKAAPVRPALEGHARARRRRRRGGAARRRRRRGSPRAASRPTHYRTGWCAATIRVHPRRSCLLAGARRAGRARGFADRGPRARRAKPTRHSPRSRSGFRRSRPRSRNASSPKC